jgi:hypothetical protein
MSRFTLLSGLAIGVAFLISCENKSKSIKKINGGSTVTIEKSRSINKEEIERSDSLKKLLPPAKAEHKVCQGRNLKSRNKKINQSISRENRL